MAPWISASLFSPVVLGVLMFIVSVSLLTLRLLSERTFRSIGWMRVVGGYIGAAIALVPLGFVLGEFSLGPSLEAWLALTFAGWLALALLVIPFIFVLIAQNHGSVMMAILV